MDTIVLKQSDAIAWLKNEAKTLVDNYEDSGYTAEDTGDVIADLLGDIDIINKHDWEWVAIEECPMAVSNLNVVEMKRG